jgi:phospholipase C
MKKKNDGFDLNKNMSRRSMLKALGGFAGGALSLSFMPFNVRKVLAHPPDMGNSLQDIEHVVLLMQENRSFDHYFGTLSGVRGFDDPDVMKAKSGRSIFHQPDPTNPDNYLLPFHLNTRTSSAQKIPSTSHAWSTLHAAWDHGQMNQWVTAHQKVNNKTAPYVMGYFTREDIPFHYALADLFTICDSYHASMLGPTWPNRTYWISGMIDPEGEYGGPMTSNKVPEGGFRWTTYADRLDKAGISWKAYIEKGAINHITNNNPLKYFKSFKEADKNSSLYQRGMKASPLGKFEYDAAHDNLPKVSWIISYRHRSEHPDYLPAQGAQFLASKIDAIAANPDVWAKTAFILNYDENDGFFDHVAPPVPPKGTPGEFIDGTPIGAGMRVPCIIISPWTAGGWVSSELYDHTSVLQFLEKFTGVKEPNISQWRRDTFGDFTSVFRFNEPKSKPPVLPNTSSRLNREQYKAKHLPLPTIPGTKQMMPTQEPGKRKHIPID